MPVTQESRTRRGRHTPCHGDQGLRCSLDGLRAKLISADAEQGAQLSHVVFDQNMAGPGVRMRAGSKSPFARASAG
jgi:hypothetical protein